jgi:hypothetical protein
MWGTFGTDRQDPACPLFGGREPLKAICPMMKQMGGKPRRVGHMSNTNTTNTNTVVIIIGTVIVVLLLVLVFGGRMMSGGMMDW